MSAPGGLRRRRRTSGSVLLALAVLGAGVLTGTGAGSAAAPAARAFPTRDAPTAVALDARGTAYVGFARGAGLAVFDASGRKRPPVRLDGTGRVHGLQVDRDGVLWVHQDDRVWRYGGRGRLLGSFEVPAAGSCADPGGGLVLGAGRVYVASPCRGVVTVHSRSGRRVSTIDLPGPRPAGGLAVGRLGRRAPVRLLATVAGRARILVFTASAGPLARPLQVVRLRPGGGRRPSLTGIVVDRRRQVVVADERNHALYFLDGGNRFSRYRTLGHPPRPGSRAGRLRSPSALAQHPQDGSGMAGNLWIADAGNHRVQRWNSWGWTYWARAAPAPRVRPRGTDVRPGGRHRRVSPA